MSNHYGVSLIPIITRDFASIILGRLKTVCKRNAHKQRTGLRLSRDCIDQIFTPNRTRIRSKYSDLYEKHLRPDRNGLNRLRKANL